VSVSSSLQDGKSLDSATVPYTIPIDKGKSVTISSVFAFSPACNYTQSYLVAAYDIGTSKVIEESDEYFEQVEIVHDATTTVFPST